MMPVPADPSRSASRPVAPGAGYALVLLLAINLFNYIDRQILSATLPKIKLDARLFDPADPYLQTKLGSLTTAFMVCYMLLAPLFGRLGDTYSRWGLVGIGVIVWSLASGGSGLATSFLVLLLTRAVVGIGEAAYGPVAPSMISDMYPVERRGRILAFFYLAIPVGSALGFVLGGQIAETSLGWRGAFQVVVLPGIVLGVICFFMREPSRRAQATAEPPIPYREVLRGLLRNRSWLLNTLGMTASTFVLGGIAPWLPVFLFEREARFEITPRTITKIEQIVTDAGTPIVPKTVTAKLTASADARIYDAKEFQTHLKQILTKDEITSYNDVIFENAATTDSIRSGKISFFFGAITVVAGLLATIAGGWLGDKLRGRFPGSYFLVSGGAMFVGLPAFVAMLYVPFPLGWGVIFVAVFCLFFNTGPTNTVLANVTHSRIRASAFALNILIIHAFGDAISPVIIGFIADHSDLQTAFLSIAGLIGGAGLLWVLGAKHLAADTACAETHVLPPR